MLWGARPISLSLPEVHSSANLSTAAVSFLDRGSGEQQIVSASAGDGPPLSSLPELHSCASLCTKASFSSPSNVPNLPGSPPGTGEVVWNMAGVTSKFGGELCRSCGMEEAEIWRGSYVNWSWLKKCGGWLRVVGGGGKETSAGTPSCCPESINDGISEPSSAGSLPLAKEISYLV